MALFVGAACIAALSSPGTLGVLTVFKDEAQGMVEWVRHHMLEGVTEFVLIDDNSTDGGAEVARSLGCTVVPAKYPHNQTANFYEYAGLLNTTWQAVIDVDEFMYAPSHNSTVAKYLDSIADTNCGTILMPWRFFGPSTSEKHPISLIASGLWSEDFGHATQVKSITRREHLCQPDSFDMHRATVKTKQCVSTFPPTERTEASCEYPIHEVDMRVFDHPTKASWGPLKEPAQHIALNHYNTQSWEFYCRVKMMRGDVDRGGNFRDHAYFWQSQQCMPYFNPESECGCSVLDLRLLAKRGGEFIAQLPANRQWPSQSTPPLASHCYGTGPINPNATQLARLPFGNPRCASARQQQLMESTKQDELAMKQDTFEEPTEEDEMAAEEDEVAAGADEVAAEAVATATKEGETRKGGRAAARAASGALRPLSSEGILDDIS